MRLLRSIAHRAYSGPQDLESILGLVKKVRPSGQLNDYPGPVNLLELFQSPETAGNTQLWFDGDDLTAYALVDGFNNLLFDCSASDLEARGDAIVEWGAACLKDTDAKTLDASCRESDKTRIEFLRSHGFTRSPQETVMLERDLRLPIPDPVLPAGYTIRCVKGEGDAAALAELHRAAFGTDHITTGARLSWMRVPGYDPSLDLIVIAPNGEFAACCMCSINNVQDRSGGKLEGQTDPVATNPRHQRLGLARALLFHGLRLLKERGMQTAGLGTRGDNLAMQKAAESAGFHISLKKIWFEKAIK